MGEVPIRTPGQVAVDWREFQKTAPRIAAAGAERFQRSRLALIGTLARGGWPRISPVEPLFLANDLVLGMIWKSTKALDLLRNPRCVLHSIITNPDANEGEFKLRGRAIPVEEAIYFAQIRESWRIAPPAPLHVFRIEVLSASFTTYQFDQGLMLVERWDAITGATQTRRAYP
jgi:hypothetical protein